MVLATIDQKDADLEYRPVKMCEFVMAVGKKSSSGNAGGGEGRISVSVG